MEKILPSASVKLVRSINVGICQTRLVKIDDALYVQKLESVNSPVDALQREWLTSAFAQALGFDFVPETFFCRDEEYNFYSIQRFVDNARTYNDTPRDIAARINPYTAMQANLFDYLIQQADRHGGNAMVTNDAKLYLIDNQYTFPDWDNTNNMAFCCCYWRHINTHASVLEFASRLNAADLTTLESNLKPSVYVSFVERIKAIGRFAFLRYEDMKEQIELL